MFFQIFVLFASSMFTMAALLPHPHRIHHHRHDYTFERNCFFSPAQCLLGNFPRSSKLAPMLNVFEDKSLTKIYSRLMISNSRPAFFGSRK